MSAAGGRGGMRHSACRRALIEGDLHPEVAEHLDGCERCRTFARDLGQLAEYAQEMAPGPAPEGLADRVIAHVQSAAAAAADPDDDVAPIDLVRERSIRRSPLTQRPVLAVLSIAAVAALLLGALAVLPRSADDGTQVADPGDGSATIDPLLAAARQTIDTRTARVRLSGTAHATITPPDTLAIPEVQLPRVPTEALTPPPFQPPPEPDYSQVPPEQQEEMRRQYEEYVEQSRRQYEEYARNAQAMYEEQYQRMQSDAASVFAQIDIPDEYSFDMTITGTGAVEFPDRMRVDGTMKVETSEPGALPVDPSAPFGVAVDGDRTLMRSPDGSWIEVPGAAGPLSPLLADPDGIARLLNGAQGEVEDLGAETIEGIDVRHYRFGVKASLVSTAPEDDAEASGPGSGTDAAAEATAEAWIGVDDDIVYKMAIRSSSSYDGGGGFTSRVESAMTLELFDFGAAVAVEIPETTGSSSAPLGPSALLAPYTSDMATGFLYAPPPETTPPTFVYPAPTFSASPPPPPPPSFPAPESPSPESPPTSEG